MADNAVDVIAHLRGQEVVWISRSAENAFGWTGERWIGSNISDRVHPDDLHAAATLLGEVSYQLLSEFLPQCRRHGLMPVTFTELRNLDLDVLKIDLSFVQNMLEDADDERVVRTIIFVARQYGLTTVAEGVETEALLRRLAELGVDRAQGYLFGKPTPIAC